MIDINRIKKLFQDSCPNVEYISLRSVSDQFEYLSVRKDQPEPITRKKDLGYMVEVIDSGGHGYAASSDLSPSGFQNTLNQAVRLSKVSKSNLKLSTLPRHLSNRGEYHSNTKKSWNNLNINDKIDLIYQAGQKLKVNDKIVEWSSHLDSINRETFFINNLGSEIYQDYNFLIPDLIAISNHQSDTQKRTLGARSYARQGGLEILEDCNFHNIGHQIGNQAIELLEAENCPEGKMDLLLSSDQMILQIHESIGHPLEIDRILGDERNYAGTSFVNPDMFGNYQYGSELLNISFNPTLQNELASYAYDDIGLKSEKEYLIKDGILKRGLGGLESQTRSSLKGVSNSRATSWNRAPIDRMANINLEPGDKNLNKLISESEYGVYMETNTSWSIDDSRNKFQFGCEYARLIENGKLTKILKNPNYRGISSTFWRNLKAVGDISTFGIHGTPNCGKGEPNQIIFVGHATPACLFDQVEVFGGDS